MAAERICLACRHALDGLTLDLGELPPCNRFTETIATAERHKMSVAACPSCGLVQLPNPPPLEMIVPRVPWIRYNEPETHLDDLAKVLFSLFRKPPRTAVGVGPFDTPLLARLASLGLEGTSFDLLTDKVQADPNSFPYLETIQSQIRPAAFVRAGLPGADIVLCRYLLEHSHDPVASLAALRLLMNPEGLLLIEVPDSSKFIAALDYCFLWEEHICYFVESTIKNMVLRAGFEIATILRYEGILEDALVIILRRPVSDQEPSAILIADLSDFEVYRSAFSSRYHLYQKRLRGLAANGKIALIGMGHQSIMFVNEFALQPFISYLVDDDPNKVGRFVPGISTPIVSSENLLGQVGVAACLLAISPHVEPNVRGKLRGLSDRGTEMVSIYAGAPGKKLLGDRP